MARGSKQRGIARAKVKNGRRAKRRGRRTWLRMKPVMKFGPGGTDKSATRNNGRAPKFSAKNATGKAGNPIKALVDDQAKMARGEYRPPEEQQEWPKR